MTAQELKNSILQMAVQGKLVPQDPNDEPASVLLERIRAEKEKLIQEGKIKREKAPSLIFRGADNTPYEKIGDAEPVSIADEVPFDIPETWEWARIKDVILYDVGGGTPDKSNPDYWGGSIPWMSVKDFSGAKDGVIEDTIDHITQLGVENSATNIIDTAAIILCTRMGLGRTARLAQPTAINQDLRAIWLSRNIDESYFLFFYSTLNITGSGVTVKGIKRDDLFSMLIPLPPIEEQKRIVVRINCALPLIQEYGMRHGKLEALQKSFPDQLRKSILQLAVQGKLVPQDTNDEPAAVLLERIRAEKERLIVAGKIKREKHESVIYRRDNSHYEKLDGVEHCIDDELPYDIPDSWQWCRIGSVLSINPRNNVPDDMEVGFMPMLLLSDSFRNQHTFEVRRWKEVKSGFTHIMDDDVVIAKITPCFQNRKSAVIVGLPNGYGAGTTELHVLRDYTHSLYMPYILLLCKTNDFIVGGVANFTGTAGQQRVGKDYVSDYLIPVPPYAEQIRIVRAANSIIAATTHLNV